MVWEKWTITNNTKHTDMVNTITKSTVITNYLRKGPSSKSLKSNMHIMNYDEFNFS